MVPSRQRFSTLFNILTIIVAVAKQKIGVQVLDLNAFFSRPQPTLSVQTLDVARQGFDVLVAQLRRDGAHDHGVAVVGALAFTESRQLLGSVGRMLATQMRESGQVVTHTAGRMAKRRIIASRCALSASTCRRMRAIVPPSMLY